MPRKLFPVPAKRAFSTLPPRTKIGENFQKIFIRFPQNVSLAPLSYYMLRFCARRLPFFYASGAAINAAYVKIFHKITGKNWHVSVAALHKKIYCFHSRERRIVDNFFSFPLFIIYCFARVEVNFFTFRGCYPHFRPQTGAPPGRRTRVRSAPYTPFRPCAACNRRAGRPHDPPCSGRAPTGSRAHTSRAG